MAKAVYILCALLSIICAGLLFRGYKKNQSKLLLWSSLGFMMLAINNIIVCIDLVILPQVDFGGGLLRNLAGAIGGALLLFGLIWEVT
jgi:hypothetical protein